MLAYVVMTMTFWHFTVECLTVFSRIHNNYHTDKLLAHYNPNIVERAKDSDRLMFTIFILKFDLGGN